MRGGVRGSREKDREIVLGCRGVEVREDGEGEGRRTLHR